MNGPTTSTKCLDGTLFEPPAPTPRTVPPSRLEIIRTVFRNPLELWGEPSYTLPYIDTKFFNQRTLIVNHPGLIRHILVDNVANYEMAEIRQLLLRPILRDGLLTAEGDVWKRGRKAMAPVFAPRHAKGFAAQMLEQSELYAAKYDTWPAPGRQRPLRGHDGTGLRHSLRNPVFRRCCHGIRRYFRRCGSLAACDGPRRSHGSVARPVLGSTCHALRRCARAWQIPRHGSGNHAKATGNSAADTGRGTPGLPHLALAAHGARRSDRDEIEDNILTFIGAGHETTARALAWTLYCVSQRPEFRRRMENEIDQVIAAGAEPVEWLDRMPYVRAAFEEGLRLYPPAPSINRQAIAADQWTDPSGEVVTIEAGMTILVMPWTLHRHSLLWESPRAFLPERFLPENRASIERFQYLPFGVGPRVCIGATFALQEAVIALSVLMHRYRFDTTPQTQPWPVQKLTTQPANGMPMRVTLRPRAAAGEKAA